MFIHQCLYGVLVFTGADKQQDSVVAAFCGFGENINQERMILLRHKPTNMPNYKLTANKAQVGSRLFASLCIEAEAVQINSVVYNLEVSIFAEKPLTGKPATCKAMRRIPVRLRFQHSLKSILGILTLTARRVAMGDTHGDARLLRSAKWKDGKSVDVTMNNLPALLFKETVELSLVFNYMLIGRNLEDSATERFNLLAGNKSRIGIDKEIELHFTAIDMTVVIHNDGFNAAAVHFSNYLCDSNRISHLSPRPLLAEHGTESSGEAFPVHAEAAITHVAELDLLA